MYIRTLQHINDIEFREKLKYLIGNCSICGCSNMLQALRKIYHQGNEACVECQRKSEMNSNSLRHFWSLIEAPEEHLQLVLESEKLQESMERLIKVVSKWGLHYPLIMPTTVKWEITNLCNLQCKHCLVSAGEKLSNELTTGQALDLVDQCVKAGVRNLGILGGEPLLRQDLFTVIDYANKNGMAVSLSTNALVINEEMAERIVDSPLQDIAISVDGIGEVHDEFRGVKGAFEKTVAGIGHLVKRDIPVTISTVVSRHNLHQLDKIIDLAVEMGVSKFAANDLQPIGRGKKLKDLCMSQEEFDLLGEIVDQKRNQYGKRIKLVWIGVGNNISQTDQERGPLLLSKCGAGLTELTIGSDGTVRGCPFLSPTTENIKKKSLEEIWFTSPQMKVYQDRFHLKGKCGKCVIQYSCSGCRARAESYLHDVQGPDIRCRLNYTSQ